MDTAMRTRLIYYYRQGFWLLVLALFLSGCGGRDDSPKGLVSHLASEKDDQAHRLFRDESIRFPPEARQFFRAAEDGQWDKATNLYAEIRQKYIIAAGPPTNARDAFMAQTYASLSRLDLTPTNYWPPFHGPQWQPIEDVNWAIFQFQQWDPELIRFYATNIIRSIPAGSVFISGMASGLFVIPTFNSRSGGDGEPFITLTPNKLLDYEYVDYVRRAYGTNVRMFNPDDVRSAYADYISNATQRAALGQLKPGEIFTNYGGGRAAIVGDVGMMEINARLLQRLMFAYNTNRDFYYEERWPLDWTTPYLIPHGLIFKINRTPLDSLEPAVLAQDRQYWKSVMRTLTGLEVDDATTLSQISNYVDTVYVRKDLSRFQGNPHYVTNEIAQTTFAKLRVSIARVYAWRATNFSWETDRLAQEADLVFRQTLVLNPRLPELDQYGAFLYSQKRTNDLQSLAGMIKQFNPGGSTAEYLDKLANYHP